MLNELSLVIENKDPFSKVGELFQIGVPFPEACVVNAEQLVLIDKHTLKPFIFSYQPLAVWPDASIKFLLLTFTHDLNAFEKQELGLVKKDDLNPEQVQAVNALIKNKHEFSANFDQTHALSIPMINAQNGKTIFPYSSELSLVGENGHKAELDIAHSEKLVRQASGCVHTLNKQEGRFNINDISALRFISTQEWFEHAGLLKWEFTLWNDGAAIHPGGCWDLGDPGSVLFESLTLHIVSAQDVDAAWRLNAPTVFEMAAGDVSIQQTGSACGVANEGDINFNRNAHKNAQGDIPNTFNGCEVKRASKLDKYALRASPEVFLSAKNTKQNMGMAISLAEFWQNFPKALNVDETGLTLALFPKYTSGETFELQAGERKTHTFYIQFTQQQDQLSWVNHPSSKVISSEWIAQCSVFSFFLNESLNDPLAPFVTQGVEGDNAFNAKREKIDEYGWRNFGEVYADHETLYQKENEPAFVSHYNNQYDAIYGFIRQYAQTGDTRWFQLMDELARHVADIDIYHTEEDRVEYNNGLFWHTDHYLDAQTCTHRTFSKHNQTSSTPGQTGGGPGTEHCYSTGLLYHYWLTGNERSKEAVIKLANWMIATHDGAKSFLAQVLSAKNKELPKLIACIKGQMVNPYVYPFTRGTGNFMATLIDAFQLSRDDDYLNYLEHVIQNTLHPHDDISMRNLHDIENTWSYVVLLQSLAKYLSLKEELKQLDQAYAYARESFMHYAQWMLNNESPYLSRTDILEFPNDTWVAQELRKVSIWVSASKYSEEHAKVYMDKAHELLTYIVGHLEKSPEKHFSRIQILLMQSYGPHLFCKKGIKRATAGQSFDFGAPKKLRLISIIFALLKKVIGGLRYLSPKNEREWIKTRRS